MATYKNLSISSKKGMFYQKSKEPKDGYEEVIYGTDSKKTYHKYENGVKGTPKSLEERGVTFDGKTVKYLELIMEEEDDLITKISTVSRNKGVYMQEAKAMLSAFDKYEPGNPVTIIAKNSSYDKKDGTKGTNLNIYVNYQNHQKEDGKDESTGYIEFKDIPKATSTVKAGETVWNFDDQTEFYYNKQQEISKRLNGSTDSDSTSNKPEPLDDELPF